MNNYIVVGAGGTGTHLLPALYTYLRAFHGADEWMLWIIDGDVVETKNLARQLFAPGDISVNKAVAAAAALRDEEHVNAQPTYLSEENIPRYIQDGDTVFICADNFTVRKRIEEHFTSLYSGVLINGGNEDHSGSCQLWLRSANEDITPRISYLHPEVKVAIGEDRAAMTCVQAAALPGGQQTIVSNMMSAVWMLTALWRVHNTLYVFKNNKPGPSSWTEIQFDLKTGETEHIDQRMSAHWRTPCPSTSPSSSPSSPSSPDGVSPASA